MSDPESTREAVSAEYARALRRARDRCRAGTEARGVVTASAGYRPEELAGAPADAVASSSACGDPVALGGIGPGDTVLDLGCGAGLDLVLAARRAAPGGKVIGVDMTAEMVEQARANAAEAGLENVEVRQGIIEALPVEDASIDRVISNCAINLSPEKGKVFAEIARVLRPGGTMLVSDIVVRELPAWVLESRPLYCACIGGAASEEEYLAGLSGAGLVDAEVRGRKVLDATQIAAFINAELLGTDVVPKCSCEDFLTGALAGRIGEVLAGKVTSLSLFARKPAAELR